MKSILVCLSTLVCLLLSGCSSGSDDSETINTDLNTKSSVGEGVPKVYENFYNGANIYLEGNYVVVEVDGTPDHKSPYYPSSSDLYEAYNGSNNSFNLNPNPINSFDFKYRIPLNPQEANNKESTPMGHIGVAINGVSFFNQYAAQNAPLTNEINSFDQYNGHPQPEGVYHYHIEPIYLTQKNEKDGFLGFLLDGFPVYGPLENDLLITNEDLDAYHGHNHSTSDYPDGIYHYHITDNDPYINGNGFYGTPGTVTK